MLANAPGGLDGQVSKAWKQATDPAVSGAGQQRRGDSPSTSSGRARYWREAMKIHAQAPWLGTGAGSYGTCACATASTRAPSATRTATSSRRSPISAGSASACRWPPPATWLGRGRASGRPAAPRPRAPVGRRARRTRDAGRGRGVSSACTRRSTGPGSSRATSYPALLCAGWVASRVTLRERLERDRAAAPADAARSAAAGRRRARRASPCCRRGVRCSRCGPCTRRPPRSSALDKGALDAAASIAQIAHERNPLVGRAAVRPAAIRAGPRADGDAPPRARAGDRPRAGQPRDVAPPRAIRLTILNDPKGALSAFQAALYLDPQLAEARSRTSSSPRGRSRPPAARPAGRALRASTAPGARWSRSRPADASVRASERRVKKRTCWPSGSKCVSKRVSAITAACAAVVRHGQQQPPVALEHAPHLVQRRRDVRDVLEHLRAPDEVELAVAERERAVRLHEPHLDAGGSRALGRGLGDLHADRVRARVAERRQERARSAAQVEHALAGPTSPSSSARRRSHSHGSGPPARPAQNDS